MVLALRPTRRLGRFILPFLSKRAAAMLSIVFAALSLNIPASYAAPHAVARAQVMLADSEIPNLSMVSPNLYRGGQPTAEGFADLKRAGIETVISLTNEKKHRVDEEKWAADAGLRLVAIPLNAMKRPSEEDIQRFLTATKQKDNSPTFIHCVHGRDRTGAMVALYRMYEEGWSADEAYNEMLMRGFRPFFTGLSNSVFDHGKTLGRDGTRPSTFYVATHMGGHEPEN